MPDPVLGAGHPAVMTKTPSLLGADIMVDSIDVRDQMIRLKKPQRRAFEVEGSGPTQAGCHTQGSRVDQR